jgi:uncharacterized protein YjbI with pentapeptide repeats
MRGRDKTQRGLGPFTGGQLTVVIVAIAAMFAIPTAALAAGGAFTNNSATVPAVQATNSNAHGTGVKGSGNKYGVFSDGPLGVAAGKALNCAGCVGGGALAKSARTFCSGYPHQSVDWSIPGSSPGHGCSLIDGNLVGASMAGGNFTNADFLGTKLNNSNLALAKLNGALLSSTNFTGAQLPGANFTGANAINAMFTNANLTQANMTNTSLEGADLTGVTDTGVTWSNTTCPDGSNSNSHGSTCSGFGAP